MGALHHPQISTCLWFDKNGEEAANFYVSVFDNSRIKHIAYYGKDEPGPEGQAMLVTFEINGNEYLALNGGPQFKFSEAVSLVVNCRDQKEINRYWNALLEGGKPSQCGWLKDKFGFSWQIVPVQMDEMMKKGTKEQNSRLMQAMLKMVRLDLAELEKAWNGN
ncbi:VOC family protein [Flavobacterium silvaticum]|uniref:VOC family protein n=1 Tax=Flavobacterium silvaticum TaxID=1852020 RepID=A0A972JFN8_9FLAO|nr:VOC family protein [Flavobacterium silvaticum]NMH28169.1 VOC family protein [Flavobacterium silvaticum]